MTTVAVILAGLIATAALTEYVLAGRRRGPIPKAERDFPRKWPEAYTKEEWAAHRATLNHSKPGPLTAFDDCCTQLELHALQKRSGPLGTRTRAHRSGKRKA